MRTPLLWQRGYVEPVAPPTLPRHIVAQQILGLVLQERQVVRADIQKWLGSLAGTPGVSETLRHLVAEGFLIDVDGLISIGPRAEQEFGRRFFRDLTSTFTSEPSFTAFAGREALGELPALTLASRRLGRPLTVLLGGRSWMVRQVDWRALRTYLVHTPGEAPDWWTFAGHAANTTLSHGLPSLIDSDVTLGPLRLRMRPTSP